MDVLKVAGRTDESVLGSQNPRSVREYGARVATSGGLEQLPGVLAGGSVALAGAEHPHELADDAVAFERG